MERNLIKSEGFIVLIATVYIYSANEFHWWLFLILLLIPDVSVFAYLINQDIGAKVYNLFHTYTISILMILIGAFLQQDITLGLGLIWTAHIGMDRMLGFGLKYNTSFQDTHIQKI